MIHGLLASEAPSLTDFFALWELFGDAVWTAVFAGALLGLLGVYVVARRLVFLSAAVSQVASLGVVLTFWLPPVLGVDLFLGEPLLGAWVVTSAGVLLVAVGPGGDGSRRDGLLGLLFLIGAAGTLTLGTRIVQDIPDVNTLLFGTAVAVVPEDFHVVMILAAVLLPLHLWWHRGFTAVSFDRDGARVRGLPVAALETALWLGIATAIAIGTRVLGALPTFAFSILPGLAALRAAPNVHWALGIAAGLGALAGFGGYLLAFLWELPAGATQALVAAALVGVVELVARALARLRPAGREALGAAAM